MTSDDPPEELRDDLRRAVRGYLVDTDDYEGAKAALQDVHGRVEKLEEVSL